MLVVCTDGLLTLSQRDSREPIGDFLERSIITHSLRLNPSVLRGQAGTSRAKSLLRASRMMIHEGKGCSYPGSGGNPVDYMDNGANVSPDTSVSQRRRYLAP